MGVSLLVLEAHYKTLILMNMIQVCERVLILFYKLLGY